MLTEQLKYIKQELGLDKDDKHMIIDGFSGVIASKQVSEDVRKVRLITGFGSEYSLGGVMPSSMYEIFFFF